MRIANAASMKAMEAYAIQTLGVSSVALMENAARAVTEQTMALLGGKPGKIAVFCGAGNNGGDGVAAARFLLERGCSVRCFLAGKREKLTPDTAEMERRLVDAGGRLEDFDGREAATWLAGCDAAVDALFGTGLNSALRGVGLAAAQLLNESGVPVVSCDIASGVETDTGRVLGEAVSATLTVTFSMAKPGQLLPPGTQHTGNLVIADIGIPPEAQRPQPTIGEYLTRDYVSARLPERRREAHKGDFGRVLLLCGSRGLTGAADLASRAALRTGAGMVSLGVPEAVYPILAVKAAPEVMVFPLPCDGAGRLSEAALPEIFKRLETMDACLLGPGLGRSEELDRLVPQLISHCPCPLVLDADGINAAAQHRDVLRGTAHPLLLTPHDGEFVRLGGDLNLDRFTATQALSDDLSAIVVRKGYRTVIAGEGQLLVNATGNPGMATGGSGDALAGMLLALLGQGLSPLDAAACGVWLHGAAGDLCAGAAGEYGLLPSDLIAAVPRLLP